MTRLGWRQRWVLLAAPEAASDRARIPNATDADRRAARSLRAKRLVTYERGWIRRTDLGDAVAAYIERENNDRKNDAFAATKRG